ncbi:hypothetical protein D3C73_1378670 [compost metagenome]
MNQLISNVLGIREEGGDLIIDPILPDELDGTRFDFEYSGAPISFVYHIGAESLHHVTVNGQEVQTDRLANPYRLGGLRIAREDIKRLSGTNSVTIDIYM